MKNMIAFLLFFNIVYAEVEILTSNSSVTDTVNQNEEKRYKIAVSAGKELASSIIHLAQDADIYVRIGAFPTTTEYDCRSLNGGISNDSCSIIIENDAEVFVTVYGFKSTTYTLTSSIKNPDSILITDINLNQVTTSSVVQGEFNYYKLSAEANVPLSSVLNHLTADADIYVKIGEVPTRENYDCRSTNGSTAEDACSLTLTTNSDVYVGVYGYRASDYQLIVQNAFNRAEILTSGITINSSLAQRESKTYKISVASGATLTALLSELNADLDLYVKTGSIASRDNYDFRSINGQTNDENYEALFNTDSEVYLTVYAYQAGTYSLLVNNETIDNTIVLENNTPHNDSIEQGIMNYYKIAGSNQDIEVILDELTTDLDLYVRIGAKPTLDSYDCRSANTGVVSDYCLVAKDPQGRDVYVGIYGYRAGDYKITGNYKTPLSGPTVYEDAEGGILNPNWERSGSRTFEPVLTQTPNIPGAPEGEGVLVLIPGSGNLGVSNYTLEVNNYTQTILSVDCGGLPDFLIPYYNGNQSRKGYIYHYNLGVSVETLQGTRKMHWYSFFNHNNVAPFASGSQNTLLNYPSPVETTSGYYQATNIWNHFEVDLNEELQKLEPGNKIYKVNYFYASGGFLDNIQLSSAQ